MATKSAILKEIERRKRLEEEAAAKPQFLFDDFCFEAQKDFFRGEGSRFRAAVCSRRAGKTVGIVGDAVDTLLREKNILCVYITLTKQSARAIIWQDLVQVVDEYQLNIKLDHLRLEATCRDTGSRFVLAGAKDQMEIEKFRGLKIRKVYLDEVQSFRSYVKYFANDILIPALRDLKGELYATGTPGPVKAGYFYEISQSRQWNNHKWTAFNNPFMHDPENGKDLEDTLSEERLIKNIDVTDPGYLRETYGEWVEDMDSLVFKFDRTKNTVDNLPEGDYDYIFGVDIGYEDSDAIAVLAFDYLSKKVYLVEELETSHQGITPLVNQITKLKAKYNPVKMVLDAGALGKKIQEEIRTRHGVNLVAAEKTRKSEFIELLNDDLRTEKFKAIKGSAFEEDCFLVQWDREARARNPESPKISRTYHSDIADAVLYAWRECKHYLSQPVVKRPGVRDPGYMQYLEEKEMEAFAKSKEEDFGGPSQAEIDSIYDDY